MANTYKLIGSTVLSTSTATVTFSSIPNTYTDLVLRMSTRFASGTFGEFSVTFNSDTTSLYSYTIFYATGGAVSTYRGSNATNLVGVLNGVGTSQTANTFTNNELYIPRYTASISKPISITNATETNGTTAYRSANAGLYRSQNEISSISIFDNINAYSFAAGSSFYLYGI